MSTAASFNDVSLPVRLRRPVTDLRSLLAFRTSSLERRQRIRVRIGLGLIAVLTLAAAVVPAVMRATGHSADAGKFVGLMPTIYLGFLAMAVLSAASSGGGREVVARDQAVAFPITPATDHLGALLFAPLNIAWMLQAWLLIGMTVYTAGTGQVWAVVLTVAVWLFFCTAVAQMIAWVLEWVRRGPGGQWWIRGLTLVLALGAGIITLSDGWAPLLDRSPTVQVYVTALYGAGGVWWSWAWRMLVLIVLTVVAVLVGVLPAAAASRRTPRDEHRIESANFVARANPTGDFVAMLRLDRATIWRSVPLRRGIAVLALMPGLVAVAGNLGWERMTILPGLVASGAALLFGVNVWCLDARGALWRQSVPVSPALMFAVRAWVLLELLLGAALVTTILGGLRSGSPTAVQLTAVLVTTVVVAAMVLSAAMRWSVAKPFHMDLRSSRATPAPPIVMVGYSARLAVATTVTGLIFSGLAESSVSLVLGFGLVFVLFSMWRIARALSRWEDPVTRARVVVTVTG